MNHEAEAYITERNGHFTVVCQEGDQIFPMAHATLADARATVEYIQAEKPDTHLYLAELVRFQ